MKKQIEVVYMRRDTTGRVVETTKRTSRPRGKGWARVEIDRKIPPFVAMSKNSRTDAPRRAY